MIPQQDARKALIARITRCLGDGSPEFVPCEMCRGGDPYCRNCGGVGEVLHPDENDEPRELLRLALEALSASSGLEEKPKSVALEVALRHAFATGWSRRTRNMLGADDDGCEAQVERYLAECAASSETQEER
jgi:hypothetical protein